MSDIYTDEDDEQDFRPGALDLLRAEARRRVSQLEHRLEAAASDVMDETRMLARRAEYRIHSRFGTAALIALGSGVVLGLVAAALSSRSRRRRGRFLVQKTPGINR